MATARMVLPLWLKIRLVFSTPGQPQGRGRIERFFRMVDEMFLCDLDGDTARSGRKPTLTLNLLEKQFHIFLLEVYHRRPSSEGKLSPQNDGNRAAFCLVCPTAWSDWICC